MMNGPGALAPLTALFLLAACGGPVGPIGKYEQFVMATSKWRPAPEAVVLETRIVRPGHDVSRGGSPVRLPNAVFGPFDVLASAGRGQQIVPRPNRYIPPALGSNGLEYRIAFFAEDLGLFIARSTDGIRWSGLRSLGRIEQQSGGPLALEEDVTARPYLYFDHENKTFRAILRDRGGVLFSLDVDTPGTRALPLIAPGGAPLTSAHPAPAGLLVGAGGSGADYALWNVLDRAGAPLVFQSPLQHRAGAPSATVGGSVPEIAGATQLQSVSGVGFTTLYGYEDGTYLAAARPRSSGDPGDGDVLSCRDVVVFRRASAAWRPFAPSGPALDCVLNSPGAAPVAAAMSIASLAHAVIVTLPQAGGSTTLKLSRVPDHVQGTEGEFFGPWEEMSLATDDVKDAPIVAGPFEPRESPCDVGAVIEFAIHSIGRQADRGEVFGPGDEEDLTVLRAVVARAGTPAERTLEAFPPFSRHHVNIAKGAEGLLALTMVRAAMTQGQAIRVMIEGTHDGERYTLDIPFAELMQNARNTDKGRLPFAGTIRGEARKPGQSPDEGGIGVRWMAEATCLGE